MNPAYLPLRPADAGSIPVRGWRLHLRRWGHPRPGVAPLVLLHGWMDTGASWQFVVDAMRSADPLRETMAPDWRGFGRSEGPVVDHFQFDDYLGDLDALLDRVSPGVPVDLVGHSMGGNIAMLYAGIRPGRVRRLVNLEGVGMPDGDPADAAERHARWLDQLAAHARGGVAFADYGDLDAVAGRLRRTNPRLRPDRALWLAGEWSRPVDGGFRLLGDPAHRVVLPRVHRADEVLAHYRAIRAPTMVVLAADTVWKPHYRREDFLARMASVAGVRIATVADAGHMLHHDRPDAVAASIEEFLG